MAWLSRANWAPSDVLSYTALNNLANDIRTWGGNVNAGGYKLFNFEIDAPVSMTSTTTNAAAIYNVDGVAGPGLMQVNTFNNDPNAGSGALFTGARGSKAAPTDVLLGDRIGAVVNSGYAGGAYRYGSSMESYVDTVGAVSASSLPADLRFYTTPNGSINRVERMRITSGGNVGIGMTPNAAYKLDVTGDVRVAGNFTATNILGLTKASVGLANVDNTSDVNKPVSTATQTALNGKQNTITGAPGAWPATFPPSAHTHAESDIPTLAATLALKANLAAPAFTDGITVTGAIAASGAITSAGQTLIPSPDTTGASLLYLRRNAANNAWELAPGGAGGGGGDVYGGGNLSNVGRHVKVSAAGTINESIMFETAGNIGIGTTVSSMSGNAVAGRNYVTLKGASDAGVFEAVTGGADVDGNHIGQYTFIDPQVSPTDKRVGMIFCLRSGATAGNRGSAMGFNTKSDNGTIGERMRIDNNGNLCLGGTVAGVGSYSAARTYLTIRSATDLPTLEFVAGTADSDGSYASLISFTDPTLSTPDKRLVNIVGYRSGTTANNRGGGLIISTKTDGGGLSNKVMIDNAGNVGIGGPPSTAYQLDVTSRARVQVSLDVWGRDGTESFRIFNTSGTKYATFKPENTANELFIGYWNGSAWGTVTVQGNVSGNAGTATTATNQSGGSVNATTGTFSGVVQVNNVVNTTGLITAYGGLTSGGIANAAGGLGAIQVQAQNGGPNAAFMAFHRGGAFAAYFGLDTDGIFKVGGWSMGAVAYPILTSNNYATYITALNGISINARSYISGVNDPFCLMFRYNTSTNGMFVGGETDGALVIADSVGNKRAWFQQNGMLSLGSNSQPYTLTVDTSPYTGSYGLGVYRCTNNNEIATVQITKSRGTGIAAPATVLANDYLGGFLFNCFTNQWRTVGGMQCYASYVSGANVGGDTIIYSCNTSSVLSEAIHITNAQYNLMGYSVSQGSYRLQVNSQIFASNATIATSDGRYKENVVQINGDGALAVINALRPVTFNWKKHPVHNFIEGRDIGFIAQDVQTALANADYTDAIIVKNQCNYHDEDHNVVEGEEFLGMATANLIPILTAAIQELSTRLAKLESASRN